MSRHCSFLLKYIVSTVAGPRGRCERSGRLGDDPTGLDEIREEQAEDSRGGGSRRRCSRPAARGLSRSRPGRDRALRRLPGPVLPPVREQGRVLRGGLRPTPSCSATVAGAAAGGGTWRAGLAPRSRRWRASPTSDPLLARGLLVEVHVAGGPALRKRAESAIASRGAMDGAPRARRRPLAAADTAQFMVGAVESTLTGALIAGDRRRSPRRAGARPHDRLRLPGRGGGGRGSGCGDRRLSAPSGSGIAGDKRLRLPCPASASPAGCYCGRQHRETPEHQFQSQKQGVGGVLDRGVVACTAAFAAARRAAKRRRAGSTVRAR